MDEKKPNEIFMEILTDFQESITKMGDPVGIADTIRVAMGDAEACAKARDNRAAAFYQGCIVGAINATTILKELYKI